MKKENPFEAYAVVSQVAFAVITPLLLFIGGGAWLIDRFSLPSWLMAIFVPLGILVMAASVASYLRGLMHRYDDGKKREHEALRSDRKDNDYYDKH